MVFISLILIVFILFIWMVFIWQYSMSINAYCAAGHELATIYASPGANALVISSGSGSDVIAVPEPSSTWCLLTRTLPNSVGARQGWWTTRPTWTWSTRSKSWKLHRCSNWRRWHGASLLGCPAKSRRSKWRKLKHRHRPPRRLMCRKRKSWPRQPRASPAIHQLTLYRRCPAMERSVVPIICTSTVPRCEMRMTVTRPSVALRYLKQHKEHDHEWTCCAFMNINGFSSLLSLALLMDVMRPLKGVYASIFWRCARL